MFCQHCGNRNEDDARFCFSCGKAFTDPPVARTGPEWKEFPRPQDQPVAVSPPVAPAQPEEPAKIVAPEPVAVAPPPPPPPPPPPIPAPAAPSWTVPHTPYSTEISRRNPTYLVFLIDQSASMGEKFGSGDGKTTKAQGVADAINNLLENLVLKSAKEEGIRDYFYVSVIGYGASVGPAFVGSLAGREIAPLSEVAHHPARIEDRAERVADGRGGVVDEKIRLPIWFDPVADQMTPMTQAFSKAHDLVARWLSSHPDCYPPIVINITDGAATDGDPFDAAMALTELQSSDGNVLLFNLHLSSRRGAAVEFPSREQDLPDKFAKQLFWMSSQMPAPVLKTASAVGYSVTEESRGFVFNADMVSVITFLDIGTKRDELLR